MVREDAGGQAAAERIFQVLQACAGRLPRGSCPSPGGLVASAVRQRFPLPGGGPEAPGGHGPLEGLAEAQGLHEIHGGALPQQAPGAGAGPEGPALLGPKGGRLVSAGHRGLAAFKWPLKSLNGLVKGRV